jgi:chromosome segregation ATPase
MTERTTRRINTDALVKLCDRLDMQAALLEIIEGERIDVDLYLKSSAGLREALAEIERLRSDAATLPKVLAENERLRSDVGLHLKTATELQEARAEIERLRSDHLKTAAELREARAEIEHLQSDKDTPSERSEATAELRGMNISTFWPADWLLKFLDPSTTKNGPKYRSR